MSEEQALDRKAKKAQRDAERKKAGKKRKHTEIEDGAKDESKQDSPPPPKDADETVAKPKKRKAEAIEAPATAPATTSDPTAPKKKRRKASKPAPNGEASTTTPAEGNSDKPAKPTKSRFILFIGNLPYTATDEMITAHFRKIAPFTLRRGTDPKTGKSKGFAFLEFEHYDRMKTCIKLYHHSVLDPAAADGEAAGNAGGGGKSANKKKRDTSRKINVELTAGGGGKSGERTEKIKVKNERLEGQRTRRRELEEKEAAKKERKAKKVATGANGQMEGLHPSRLAMVNE